MIRLHESWTPACTVRGRRSSAPRRLFAIPRRRSLAIVSERPSDHIAGDESRLAPDPESEPGIPRRMTVVGIALVVLVILIFVVLHLTGVMGGGTH
jgi:hypothetical protein